MNSGILLLVTTLFIIVAVTLIVKIKNILWARELLKDLTLPAVWTEEDEQALQALVSLRKRKKK